ncbi:MAG TPA: hypothetical protein VEB20_18595 [Azospirillaceae bacterium]|nr:hypothetical protein [Azospirillaceae bacterium]
MSLSLSPGSSLSAVPSRTAAWGGRHLAVPLLIVLLHAVLVNLPATRDAARWLTDENMPVEMVTFVLMLATTWIAARLAVRLRRTDTLASAFYGLFAAGMFFIAMEEVSWGQWLVGFETPAEMRAQNVQGEFNLHNLQGAHELIELMRVVFGVGSLIGIAVGALAVARNVAVPAKLLPWFLIITVLSVADMVFAYVTVPHRISWTVSELMETVELLIAIATLFYVQHHARRLLRREPGIG